MLKFMYLKTAMCDKYKYEIGLLEISSNKLYKIKFGAQGYDDYTISKNNKKKEDYILRHRVREDWSDPLKAGTLSRFLLWNKPTLRESLNDYKERFNIL